MPDWKKVAEGFMWLTLSIILILLAQYGEGFFNGPSGAFAEGVTGFIICGSLATTVYGVLRIVEGLGQT
jgi:hypothetical protein